jgi:hypothetical protein
MTANQNNNAKLHNADTMRQGDHRNKIMATSSRMEAGQQDEE